jgi:hypothetical protein
MSDHVEVAKIDPRKLSFLDLPPEIRNQIYVLILSTDTTNIDTLLSQIPSPLSRTISTGLSRAVQKYVPYSAHVHEAFGPQLQRFGDDLLVTNRFIHADPVIWQLNRQIREEARSLYITEYLSVDVHGMEPVRWRAGLKSQLGIKLFQRWLASDVEAALRTKISKLEVRDWVSVRTQVTQKGRVSYHEHCAIIPIFAIAITCSGAKLTVRTPLQLVDDQACALQGFLTHLAKCRAKWDGNDVINIVHFLRRSMASPWGNCEQLTSMGTPFSIRFRVTAKEGEMAFEGGGKTEWGVMKTGWTYVAAEAEAALAENVVGVRETMVVTGKTTSDTAVVEASDLVPSNEV